MSRSSVDGPGRKVSAGHLRVDTARAVQKLREYQLAAHETWVLEVLRAAIILGATRLSVSGDAGDVVVAWEGGLLDDETMRSVLDELVNPGVARHDGAIRRLATGLNTALGPTRVAGRHTMAPRFVDLERTDADGRRTRVRYTGELIDASSDDSEAGLRALVATPIAAAPAGTPAGMRVHLERHTLHTFVRFLGRAEPDELRVVRECADDVPVPLHIGGDVLHCDDSSFDLLRVPLGDGLSGFVALVDPHSIPEGNQPAWVDYAERGIILARRPLALWKGLSEPRASVPIRLFLDRQALPTNASRSDIRMDGALQGALDVAQKRALTLLTELTRRLGGLHDAAHGAKHDDGGRPLGAVEPGSSNGQHAARDERLRHAALQLIAAHVRGRAWSFTPKSMPSELKDLMALPLSRDALGAPRPVTDFGRTTRLVYRGAAPLSAERYGDAPKEILFVPMGDAAERLLEDGDDGERLASFLDAAERENRARAEFLARPMTPATLSPTDPDVWVVVPLGAQPAGSLAAHWPLPPADVEGECALLGGRGATGGWVHVLHEGRAVARLNRAARFAYQAVVASPRLTPGSNYQGVVEDAGYQEAIGAVGRAVVIAAEVAARVASGHESNVQGAQLGVAAPKPGPLPRDHARTLLQVFIGALRDAAADADTPYRLAEGATKRYAASPLAQAPLVSVVDPAGAGRVESIVDVVERASATGALLYRPESAGQTAGPPGHPLALLEPEVALALALLAGVRPARVDAPLSRRPSLPHMRADVVLQVSRDEYLAEIGWGGQEGGWALVRDGLVREQSKLEAHILPVWVNIDDARVIVDGATGKVALRPNHATLLHDLEQALLAALIAAARGEAPPGLRVQQPTDVARQLCRAMAVAPRPFRKHFGADYTWLTRELRIPTARGNTVTLGTLAQQKTVWSLPVGTRIAFEHADFDPVAVDPAWQKWLESILGKTVRDGTEDLPEMARQAGGRAQRERVLASAPLPAPTTTPEQPFACAVAQKDVSGVVWVELGARQTLTLTVRGRRLCELPTPDDLPLSGRLDLPEALIDAAWDSPSRAGRSTLETLLRDTARKLLTDLASEHPRELLTPRGQRLIDAWARTKTQAKSDARVREVLSHAAAWPTVQGGMASVLTAKRRGKVHAAVFEGEWLGPHDGERKKSYDNPVIAVHPPVRDSALARFLAAVEVGELADTTQAVHQLQARRRVEQGQSERPRLGQPDALSIATLCKDDSRLLASLGPGEARLHPTAHGSNPTAVRLHSLGSVAATCALPVFPPIEVAFEGTGFLDPSQRDQVAKRLVGPLTQRMQRLAALLVRHAFENEPSVALRQATRAAWLERSTLDDALVETLPVLRTTAGDWLSLAALRATAEGGEAQWYTTDTTCTIIPEEAGRSALLLTPAEAKALGSRLTLEDATERLALQPVRLANQARPRATTLDARVALAAVNARSEEATLAFAEFGAKGGQGPRGSLVLLTPDAAGHAGLHAHRDMQPLGVHACPLTWPALVLLEDPALTPNVRFSGPEDDKRWRAACAAAVRAGEAALAARFAPGDEFGARRVDVTLPSGTLGQGVIRLGNPLMRGDVVVAGTGQTLRDYPLRGELWLCSSPGSVMRQVVGARDSHDVVRAAYGRLVIDLASALSATAEPAPTTAGQPSDDTSVWSSEERELAQAHVLLAALEGQLGRKHPIYDAWTLTCLRKPLTLRETCAHMASRAPVWRVTGESGSEPGNAELGLVEDGSWVSRVLVHALGPRLRQKATAHGVGARSNPTGPEGDGGHEPGAASGSARKRAAERALPRLSDELSARLAIARGPVRRPPTVSVVPRKKRPLVTLNQQGDVVQLAGAHPALLAIEAALREERAEGRRAAVALAAHVLSLFGDTMPTDRVAALATLGASESEPGM